MNGTKKNNKKNSVVFLRHRFPCVRIFSVTSVVPGSRTTSREGTGKSYKGRKDTSELHVESRCTTQGNHKYETNDGIAYVGLPSPTTEETSATNQNCVLSVEQCHEWALSADLLSPE